MTSTESSPAGRTLIGEMGVVQTQSANTVLRREYDKRLMLVSGRANPMLAARIADKLGVDEKTAKSAVKTALPALVADLSTMPTHAPSGPDVLAAIELHRTLDISFWDAMVIRSASQLHCSILWSEDLSSGRSYNGVEIRNPFLTS